MTAVPRITAGNTASDFPEEGISKKKTQKNSTFSGDRKTASQPPACTAYIINAPLIENCGNCEDTEQLQIAVTIYAAKDTAAEQDL